MKTSDFAYHLPDSLIAQIPLKQRSQSRLLLGNYQKKSIENHFFYELPEIIQDLFPLQYSDSKRTKRVLFLLNDSRVFPARVRIRRKTGGRGEVFLLEKKEQTHLTCLLRPKDKLKVGETLYSDCDSQTPLFNVASLNPPLVSLAPGLSVQKVLASYGEMPLPPYIARGKINQAEALKELEALDKERYQTVYANAEHTESVAAPTAGLHFTPETIETCMNMGADFASITLHVGLGTFAPVQTEHIFEHPMHEEYYTVSEQTCKKICTALQNNIPIVYVGTTSLRATESFLRLVLPNSSSPHILQLAAEGSLLPQLLARSHQLNSTKLFIHPNNKSEIFLPKIGCGLITNFHQPESTLTMLVASLVGYDFWKKIYDHAIEEKYRFLSYGDSSFLLFR